MTANLRRLDYTSPLWSLLLPASGTAAAQERGFATPESAGAAAVGTAGHMLQTLLALVLVLALVLLIAWFSRRLRSAPRNGVPALEVLAQATLGAKERAVLVKVGDALVLLGVAPGCVRPLHVLSTEQAAAVATTRPTIVPGVAIPNFADLLRRSLGVQ